MGWRRFLGFLMINEPEALEIAPPERLTTERVRRFAKHLAETNTPHSVAIQMDSLYGAARTMMPTRDWAMAAEYQNTALLRGATTKLDQTGHHQCTTNGPGCGIDGGEQDRSA